ncbi:MAG: hypothetical protein IPJ84_18285 [Bdellovibrionales bacterium]|nr:hypothetical protein [Bdellovibrionales bacterium]
MRPDCETHVDYSQKLTHPFETLRLSPEPMLVIYDVLGHFPSPRDHLSLDLRRQFTLRSKNGFLYSKKNDVVLVAVDFDPAHQTWLQRSGFAFGEALRIPAPEDGTAESYFEAFLKNALDKGILGKKLSTLGIKKIFSWMNSPNEMRLADELGLSTAWNTIPDVVRAQFNKQTFKQRLELLDLPTLKGFLTSVDRTSRIPLITKAKFEELCLSLANNSRLIARPTEAAAGSGIFCFSTDQIDSAWSTITGAEPTDWLIEPFIDDCRSVNLQLLVRGPGIIDYLGLSEQRLNRFMYSGNEGLSSVSTTADSAVTECLRQGEVIARDIAAQSYTGLIGLDFIITPKREVFAIENNIRINGSTFSLALVAQLENSVKHELAWSYEKFTLPQSVPFERAVSTFGNLLLEIRQPLNDGFFIQEYSRTQKNTELATTLVASNRDGLEALRSEIKKRIELFNERIDTNDSN